MIIQFVLVLVNLCRERIPASIPSHQVIEYFQSLPQPHSLSICQVNSCKLSEQTLAPKYFWRIQNFMANQSLTNGHF